MELESKKVKLANNFAFSLLGDDFDTVQNPQPGDMALFYKPDQVNGHIGLYVGNNYIYQQNYFPGIISAGSKGVRLGRPSWYDEEGRYPVIYRRYKLFNR